MTKKTSADLITSAASNYPDNTTGAIKAINHRNQHGDNAESCANHLDLTNAATFQGQGLICDKTSGLVIPGESPFLRIDQTANTLTTATVNEWVGIDASAGNVTVNAPLNPLTNQRFGVKRTDSNESTFIEVTGNSQPLEPPYSGFGATTDPVSIRGLGAMAWWQWSGSTWVLGGSHKVASYYELWQATPITDISQAGELVQWTLLPLFTGQVERMLTHSSGTLTNPTGVSVDMTLSAEFDLNINSNNADTGVTLDPALTSGSGVFLWPDISTAFGHSRSATYPMSGNSEGIWNPAAANETFTVTATADNNGGADSDLNAAILIVELVG